MGIGSPIRRDATGRHGDLRYALPLGASTHLVSRDGAPSRAGRTSGRELFFKSGTQLMAVTVTPGTTFTPARHRPLFSLTGYRGRATGSSTMSPDGQHFVMIRELSSDQPLNVIYAENWRGSATSRRG